jgi:hypothetical protein
MQQVKQEGWGRRRRMRIKTVCLWQSRTAGCGRTETVNV